MLGAGSPSREPGDYVTEESLVAQGMKKDLSFQGLKANSSSEELKPKLSSVEKYDISDQVSSPERKG